MRSEGQKERSSPHAKVFLKRRHRGAMAKATFRERGDRRCYLKSDRPLVIFPHVLQFSPPRHVEPYQNL
ncbi:hypothetical protein SLEP1_g52026 [Rubroshorea leprosula]|uniref:Uncharacterized protein n=1 Tax=Rubroshorea leprosula TaxID=152421 RepID=A0AAV5M542_9ROSI|nr:hypothetical protein SLEP1_g52026 [Rubroshorea leprosula]